MSSPLGKMFESFKSGTSSAIQSLRAQVMNPKMLVFYTVVPIGLYMILAPGLILSLPPTDKVRCSQIVPIPDDMRCIDKLAYRANGSTRWDTSGVGIAGTNEVTRVDADRLCAAVAKCNGYTTSGTVGAWATLVHGFLFLVLLQVSMKLAQKFLYE